MKLLGYVCIQMVPKCHFIKEFKENVYSYHYNVKHLITVKFDKKRQII